MDETDIGTRDARGHWRPDKPLSYPAIFSSDINLAGFTRWLKGFLFGWNLGWALLAVLFWVWLTPPLEQFTTFSLEPIAAVLARNTVLVVVFFGAYHLRLYWQRAQGTQFKYNPEWLAENKATFLFRNQTRDNLFWTFASGVPVWTAYEVLTLWAMANGYITTISWQENPVWFIAVLFLIPLFREVHFYFTHRLIHWKPLYRKVHSLHHKNINPGPWSGLAMHPVEHIIYFSGVLLHWVVASHPIHAIFHLIHLGLAPAAGHSGFEKVVVGEDKSLDTHCFAHYLHHKHFECNYSDGVIPLDKWFGTFHDGSDESFARMRQRLKEKRSS